MVAPLNSYGSVPRIGGVDATTGNPGIVEVDEETTLPQSGVNLDDLYQNSALTSQQIQAVMQALQAQLQTDTLGVGLQGENLAFQRDIGMREIAQSELEGLEAARNNALQRGIFNSGIRVKNQQDVIKQAGEAKSDLQRGITLGLQQLQLQVAQLQNQFAVNFGQQAIGLGAELESFNAGLISGNQVYGGGASGGSNANNTNPANIAAAKAGEGAYGARAQLTASFASQWQQQFPGLAIEGANYFRPASQSTGGGRDSNSDHITGGALDIFVRTPEERAAFNAWYQSVFPQLQQQGLVAEYVPVGGNAAHNDHMHISFSLTGAGASSSNTSTAVSTTSSNAGRAI